MPAAYALVPVIGGLSLMGGGLAALYRDRLDLLADLTAPRPILVRYTSQATYHLHQWPHWIFLSACCIFAPCIMVTSSWQGQLADSEDDIKTDVRTFAYGAGIFAVLLASIPMGNLVGTVLHSVVAGGFAICGINYGFRAKDLAAERSSSSAALEMIRLVFVSIGMIGAASCAFTCYFGVRATQRLARHQRVSSSSHLKQEEGGDSTITQGNGGEEERNNNDNQDASSLLLKPKQLAIERRWETLLAASQMCMALTTGMTLLTGVVEVTDLEDSDDGVWITGVASAAASFVVFLGAVATNGTFYNMCQVEEAAIGGHAGIEAEKSADALNEMIET